MHFMKIFICICWFMRYYIIHLLFSFQAAWNTHLCVSKMESKMRSLRFLGWLSVLVTQTCLTLCDPMNYSPPGSSVHAILQTRIMEWVAIPFSRGSSQLRDWIWVSCTTGDQTLWSEPPWKPLGWLKIYTERKTSFLQCLISCQLVD